MRHLAPSLPALEIPRSLPLDTPVKSPCQQCVARGPHFCGSLDRATVAPVRRSHDARKARQIFVFKGERQNGLLALCAGWAIRFAQLPNGKRQAFSVHLPGDLIAASSLTDTNATYSVQAVTDVRFCYLHTGDVMNAMNEDPSLFKEWAALAAQERRDSESQLVNIGIKTAPERVATLIVHLAQRLTGSRQLQAQHLHFPLRQHHIADLTGLTRNHVCRVLTSLREHGICNITDGQVTIMDPNELDRIANGL